jgi:uncharacterized protein
MFKCLLITRKLGLGVTKDNVMAHMYFYLSVSQGNVKGKNNLRIAKQKMTQSQISEAQRLAREWISKHIPNK